MHTYIYFSIFSLNFESGRELVFRSAIHVEPIMGGHEARCIYILFLYLPL